jgi:hypothetical protein
VKFEVGSRLESQVCSTQIIIVRSPGADDLDITCGGKPMMPIGSAAKDATPEPGADGGSLLGKRYTSMRDERLEVLVTHAGAGTLGDGQSPLVLLVAKPLPSSD